MSEGASRVAAGAGTAERESSRAEQGAARRVADLSVIIPSVNGWADLEGCVHALTTQTGGHLVEIVVVDRVGPSVRARLGREFPQAVLIEAAADATIPAMRALGFGRASAEIVGVIEDHVIVPPDWTERMLAAQAEGHPVVGGSVKNAARERLSDWAAFLCEYSHCLVPPEGPSDWVTGNNVTYRRELLERFADVISEGRWENRLHDAIRDSGITLSSRPDIEVGHKKHFTVGEYVEQRYLYARSYAGMRVQDAGLARRIAYGFAALALPPLLLYRTVSRVWRAGVHRTELIRSLPLLPLFVVSWAAGEVVGYWFGPGDSLAKVC